MHKPSITDEVNKDGTKVNSARVGNKSEKQLDLDLSLVLYLCSHCMSEYSNEGDL